MVCWKASVSDAALKLCSYKLFALGRLPSARFDTSPSPVIYFAQFNNLSIDAPYPFMYEIEFTPSALEDLQSFRKFEQQQVIEEIETQLTYEPTVETRNRFRMRPNEVAEWELRIDRFRVFYNVEQQVRIVSIEVVGYKIGSQLYVRGKKRTL